MQAYYRKLLDDRQINGIHQSLPQRTLMGQTEAKSEQLQGVIKEHINHQRQQDKSTHLLSSLHELL